MNPTATAEALNPFIEGFLRFGKSVLVVGCLVSAIALGIEFAVQAAFATFCLAIFNLYNNKSS